MFSRPFLSGLVLLIVSGLSAQNGQISSEELFKKNEIGANTGPLLLAMLGSNQAIQSPVVIYKRRFTKKLALRGSLGAHPINKIYSLEGWTKYETMDGIRFSRQQVYSGNNYLVRIGCEYRGRIADRLSFVVAAEPQLMYTDVTGTIAGWLPSDSSRASLVTVYTKKDRLMQGVVEDRSVTGLHLGIGISAGLVIDLGGGFLFSPEFRLDVFYGTLKNSVTDNYTGNTITTYSTLLDLYAGPQMSEVNLFYRF